MTRWRALYGSFGPRVIAELSAEVTASPVVTIGGDQLTGKSTLAKNVAHQLGASLWSTGETLREEAQRRNLSIAEMCREAKNDLSIDLGVDVEMCRKICTGGTRPLVMQGRLPAALATVAMEDFGKPRKSVHRIYLKCSILEQALRFVSREIGASEYDVVSRELAGTEFESLADASEAIKTLPIAKEARDAILKEFVSNQSRDDDDRERFAKLYGDDFDYRDPGMYDIEIDTSDIPPEETFRRAIASIQAHMDLLR